MAIPSVLVAPSLLSADFANLGQEVAAVAAAGADWIHVDVMDGRFVPNITIGPLVIEAIRRVTALPLDVHLMIENPERYIGAFVNAGATRVSVHVEACVHLDRVLDQIRSSGARAGVALNPHTPEDALRYVVDRLDQVLVMSVNPGFGGQRFIRAVLPKIEKLAALIRSCGRDIKLVVDGGIDATTAKDAIGAGATVLVAGNAIFGQRALLRDGDLEGRITCYRDAIANIRGRAS